MIGGLIKEKNLIPRWQGCTQALLGGSWAGLHGGEGRWPSGQGWPAWTWSPRTGTVRAGGQGGEDRHGFQVSLTAPGEPRR